ncbi:phage holin family protein [Cellulomonas fimi]|uniref:phage holin family protein n=1 Tax=Cellulomonas fimi TaxID=1708 RepID=UPI002359EA5B|nr:phage holin family protein [Cellulomonas fimi]
MTTQPGPTGETRSIGQLVSDLSEQTSRLVRAELDLAKAEIQAKAQQLGIGAGLLAAAGILALYVLAAAITTAILGLSTVMDAWLAALIVTVFLLIVTVILALVGIRLVKRGSPPTPERAIENVHEDLEAVKAGWNA